MLPSHHRVVPRQHKHEPKQPNEVPGRALLWGRLLKRAFNIPF